MSQYRIHPAVGHCQAMVANLQKNTGRTMDDWLALLAREAPADPKAWLKGEHGLGGPTINLILERQAGKADFFDEAAYLAAADGYVEAQYGGKKAHLKPLYDGLAKLAQSQGSDVGLSPCKTTVPCYRKRVFAEIKPSTLKRVDLGLALGEFQGALPARLIDTGGLAKKERISHRIEITAPEQLDDELAHWLKTAYELDA